LNDALDEISRVRDRLTAFYEVRFEDVLRNPETEIERILEFCELPPITPDNQRFHDKLAAVGHVHHANNYADFPLIESLCHDYLVRYGYLPLQAGD